MPPPRRTRPGAQTVQTPVSQTDLRQAVTPTGTTGAAAARPAVTIPSPGEAVAPVEGGAAAPVSVEQAAGEAQAQSAIDVASQQANPLVRQSNLLDVVANAATFYPTSLQPTNIPTAANFSNFNAGAVTPPTNLSGLAGGVSYPQGVLGTPASNLPPIATPRPSGPTVDRYNQWLVQQGINPTTIGGAKLVTGPQGQRMMDVPSIAQETQAAQTMGQVHAKHADLMRAAQMTSRSNPTLSAQLKDAARNIFPQTSSYENNLRGYLDLIRPDALKSTAGLEQYLPTGYRPVVTPDQITQQITQQYGNLIKTAKKGLKQKRGGQVEEEEEET